MRALRLHDYGHYTLCQHSGPYPLSFEIGLLMVRAYFGAKKIKHLPRPHTHRGIQSVDAAVHFNWSTILGWRMSLNTTIGLPQVIFEGALIYEGILTLSTPVIHD